MVVCTKKGQPETLDCGTFWISTLIDMDSRLRVTRGIAKDETQASIAVFQTLKRWGHPDGPPPLLSDGFGGIDEAVLAVYGQIPEHHGKGRYPKYPKPGKDWRYLQMVKQRDEHGNLQGIRLRAVWGTLEELIALLGKSTGYVERSNLTTRLFNGRLTRKTLAFSKDLEAHRDAVTWEDGYYNFVRPHKSLREKAPEGSDNKWMPRTPAMIAGLTDHIWTVKELLMTVVVPINGNAN